MNPDLLTTRQLKQLLLPRRWTTDTEFLGPRRHIGGGWVITEEGGVADLDLADYPHLNTCATTTAKRARALAAILGKFLIQAGPFHWAFRADPLEGWQVGGDSNGDHWFWPQADGSVLLSSEPACRGELGYMLDWTQPMAGTAVERYPNVPDFLCDAFGASYEEVTTADTAMREAIATLGPDWEGNFDSLVDTAHVLCVPGGRAWLWGPDPDEEPGLLELLAAELAKSPALSTALDDGPDW